MQVKEMEKRGLGGPVHKKFSLAFFFCIILFSVAQASAAQYDVAYILEDGSTLSGTILNSFYELGLSYDVVRDSEIPTTNFSQYSVLLVTGDVNNKDLIPFEEKSAIFFYGPTAVAVWGGTISAVPSSARNVRITDKYHKIVEGVLPEGVFEIQVYSQTKSSYYLSNKPSFVKALGVGTQSNSDGKGIISYSERIIAEKPVRDIFFALPESTYWTSNSERMFENSLNWLLEDIDQDGDGHVFGEDCNDQNNSIYPGALEVPYDGIDQDCSGYDELDADGDGYCASEFTIQNALAQCSSESGTKGTDCDDEDSLINPDNPDTQLNCINDAPTFITMPTFISSSEGELISFEVIASDPEDDELIYEINDNRFNVNDNEFSWQTTYADQGSHAFIVTVSDSDYSVSQNIEIELADVNQPPVAEEIPDVSWTEDTNKIINISEYFSDSDGDALTFGFDDSNLENMEVTEIEEGLFGLVPLEDYFGEEEIVFYASDGNDVTESNIVVLTVLPVNDAPIFADDLENLTWTEDYSFESAIDLSDHFQDVDSELTFEAIGNEHVDVVIEDGIVSFYPEHDFAGTEEIYFNATDGQFSVESNKIKLTIIEAGEPPVFVPFSCETNIEEDSTNTCTIEATDFEGNDLEFSVVDEDSLSCELNGIVLTYSPESEFYGPASCTLRVSDIDGFDEQELNVTVSPVNDAPIISSANPSSEIVRIIEGRSKTFSVEFEDIDSNALLSWIFNGAKQNATNSSYVFSQPLGTYSLEANVSDEEFSVSKFWQVIVAPASEFTCSEVGGSVCSADDVCADATITVQDTSLCCMTRCIPTFDDAGACEAINNDIQVRVIEPSSGDEIILGETVTLEFKITNTLEDSENVDLSAHLYNLDKDNSEESVETEVEVRPDVSRTVRLDMDFPEDLNLENNYAIFVTVSRGDEICNQNYSLMSNIKRQKDKLEITKFSIPAQAYCGEVIPAEVMIENQGSDEQEVTLFIENKKLDIDTQSDTFDLESYDNDDKETKEFSITLPLDVQSGMYDIKATATYDTFRVTELSTIEIICEEETVSGAELQPQQIEDAIMLNQFNQPSPENGKKNYVPAIAFMILNFMLICSAVLLYVVNARKSKHSVSHSAARISITRQNVKVKKK